MCKRLFQILAAALCSLTLSAQTLSEQSVISLMTCTPGRPLYLHFGHSALRVQDPAFIDADGRTTPIDWTFNYGLFSFDTEHFYTKFVRGETDYMLGIQTTEYFIRSSHDEGREVFEQVLNLTMAERQQIMDALIENYQPENRVYRYNFVFDNCATRPLRLIEQALPSLVVPQDTLDVTWRDQIQYYAGRWTWGRYGINLVFGRLADEKMTVEESLFLPENLMNFIEQSGLVRSSQIGTFTPRNGQVYASPEFCELLLCLLLVGLTIRDAKRRKQSFVFDGVLYGLYLLLCLVITFLMFFSTHPFVTENVNWLVVNPLWVIPLMLCFWKGGRKVHRKLAPAFAMFVVLQVLIAVCSGQAFHPFLILPILHAIRWVVLYFCIKNRHA